MVLARIVTVANLNLTVYDYVNVADIHNRTIPSFELLDESTLFQLRTLADHHEFGLAYNASDNARAVSGMQLAGEVVKYLNGTITSGGKQKMGIQFGAYATFLSFFGLSNLTAASQDFYGVNDYASSMVFELFGTNGSSAVPAIEDLQVRFLFHNGSSANTVEPTAFPLFGNSSMTVPWTIFADRMGDFAIHTTEQWCKACGNSTGACATSVSSDGGDASSTSQSSSGSGGVSKAVAGVIGAMVTLGVILGLEALILAVGGFRLVSKKRLQTTPIGSVSETVKA
jgi:hypothetical protein